MRLARKLKIPGLITIAALSVSLAVPLGMAYLAIHASQTLASNQDAIQQTGPIVNVVKPNSRPRIQMAILLDTSSSMDGLIDQARQQIWQVVNTFSTATQNGLNPRLEVAVYEYGNDGLAASTGYIRRVSGLTSELDQVSAALFSLKTNGGNEYCGQVIQTAVNQLEWSQSDNDIKAIFIAGNEPFTQGPTPFREAINAAREKGIVVNTIHAGSYEEGARSGWKDGAVLAGGNFMSIDHNQQVTHIDAPQDKRIAELNAKLNQTYIPYGDKGRKKQERQLEQDAVSSRISAGLLAKRAESKSLSYYDNSSWDLVDAQSNGKLKLDKLNEEKLPAKMRAMNKQQRKEYLARVGAERKRIQAEIVALSKKRDAYVAEQRKKIAGQHANTVKDALISAVRAQGKARHFEF
ncbi:MAG: vWA domain-containing protein [Thioalkalispiraceae bacterium]|jgi:hypothetical protein